MPEPAAGAQADPSAQILAAVEAENAALNKQNDMLRQALAERVDGPRAAVSLASPAHPDHHAWRWGVFLGFLALAAVKAGPLVGTLAGNQKIDAALQGGGSILGDLLQAELAASGN